MVFYRSLIYLTIICNVFSFRTKLSLITVDNGGKQYVQQKFLRPTNDITSLSNFQCDKKMALNFEKNSDGPISSSSALVGEDAATFDLSEQKPIAWIQFLIAVSGVLGGIFYVWLYESGPQWGQAFKDIIESVAGGDSTLAITYMLAFFAVCHSGLASLRPFAEEIVGPRVWRYIFAIVSLPLAFSSIVYFINHR